MKEEDGSKGGREGGESAAKLLNLAHGRQRLTMSEEKKKKDGGEEKCVESWRGAEKKSPNKRDISPEQNDKRGI